MVCRDLKKVTQYTLSYVFLDENYLILEEFMWLKKIYRGGVVPGLKKCFKSRIGSFPYANFPKLMEGG